MEYLDRRRVLRVYRPGGVCLFIPFLLVHERVSKPEQFFEWGLSNRRHLGDANAQGEAKARGGQRIGEIHTLLQALADLQGGVLTRISHQNAEFIPAKPRENVGLAKAGAQNVCGLGQCAVALQMAVGVIDQLQIVEIHVYQQSGTLPEDQAQMLLGKRQKAAAIV